MSSATEAVDCLPPESEDISWTRRKFKALLIYQWGENAGKIADLEDLDIVLSKSTGKIRHCKSDGEILFTVVPTTGQLIPTYRGGQELLRVSLDDIYKVTI
ncbi:MAG: hypothetical protein ACXAB5_08410, partial [Candidatus Thorarchaeota archaeon]